MTLWTPGPPYAYPVGCVVKGGRATGRPFEGRVVEMMGPYTVRIEGNLIVPHSLIDSADFGDDGGIEKARAAPTAAGA